MQQRPSSPERGDTPRARVVTISADNAGQRLDNFLAACFRDVPKSRLYRSVRSGEVRVNRGRSKQTYRLKEGDKVRLPPLRSDGSAQRTHSAPEAARRALRNAILMEDEHILALNKPAGLPVHAGSGRSNGLIEILKSDPERQGRFVELVHRLDQETSGCLLVAKRRSALVSLHAQLRDGEMDKRYRVLLKGTWRGGGRRVDAGLSRGVNRAGERAVRVDPQGQAASTAFTPMSIGGRASLMEARPHTGRTHQIRVHAAQALKMPVVGDPRYGDWTLNRELHDAGMQRMFLHAARLRFRHPHGGTSLQIEAPMDDELDAMLAYFGLSHQQEARAL